MQVISTQVIVIWCALGLMTVVTAVLTVVTVGDIGDRGSLTLLCVA